MKKLLLLSISLLCDCLTFDLIINNQKQGLMNKQTTSSFALLNLQVATVTFNLDNDVIIIDISGV